MRYFDDDLDDFMGLTTSMTYLRITSPARQRSIYTVGAALRWYLYNKTSVKQEKVGINEKKKQNKPPTTRNIFFIFRKLASVGRKKKRSIKTRGKKTVSAIQCSVSLSYQIN